MPISVQCPACGRGHKAPDRAAGRTFNCLACGGPMTVPAAEVDPAAVLLGDVEPPLPPPPPEPVRDAVPDRGPALADGYGVSTDDPPPAPKPAPAAKPSRPTRTTPAVATLPPLTTDDPPLWRRHLHWLLVLAMIPLAASLLAKRGEPNLLERIEQTLEDAPPDAQARFERALGPETTLDDLIAALPRERVRGAWLPRSTVAHWGMALAAAAVYFVFVMFLASDGCARPGHVLAVGVFTATVGVGFLLLVQALASLTDGRVVVGRGVLALVFLVLKFIAFSYGAAADPENGFVLSFVGFTLGVGLCEELVKAAPLFWHRAEERGKTWRGLFVWGLASGAGFGIAEGILYSGRYYNGIAGPGIYLVRFLSCVALHAIWSGSVAITLYLRRKSFDQLGAWHEWIAPVLAVIGVPMVLHGLFDTCLKRDLEWAALLVAVASFGWLAFLSSRLYGTDDAAATRAMLAEYKRRRQAAT